MEEIWHGLSAAARYCTAASLVLLIIRFRQVPLLFRILGIVLANELLTDSAAAWLFDRKINNMPLLHLYTLVSFWLFSFFYRVLFREKPAVRRYFWPYLAVVTLLLAANTLWLEPIHGFNSNAKTLIQCLFIAYVVYYLFDAFGKTDFLQPKDLPIGLVNMAILIYNAGSLFIFMFAKTLNNGLLSAKSQSGLWMMNSLLYLIFQLLLLLAIWIQAFKATKSSS
jgi:hypothetical protein